MSNTNLTANSTWAGTERRALSPVHHSNRVMAWLAMVALCLGLTVGSGHILAQEQSVAAAATVNINTADAQTLSAQLVGVGAARALEIVRYREMYGPFASPDELMEVKGIGKSTLDRNRELITLE